MGYCTIQEVESALANALTSGNPAANGALTPITTVGHTLGSSVDDAQVQQYIRWADEDIDSKINSIYRVPLSRINQGAYPLFMDATVGDMSVVLQDATRFTEGDIVLVRDDAHYQEMTVAPYTNDTSLNFTTPLTDNYMSLDTRIERIRYPEPIPLISAKLAAANLYDKHYAAQAEGNESNFGKILRTQAYNDLNQILAGAIRIKVPDANSYRGRRYVNGALFDVLGTMAEAGKKWFESSQ